MRSSIILPTDNTPSNDDISFEEDCINIPSPNRSPLTSPLLSPLLSPKISPSNQIQAQITPPPTSPRLRLFTPAVDHFNPQRNDKLVTLEQALLKVNRDIEKEKNIMLAINEELRHANLSVKVIHEELIEDAHVEEISGLLAEQKRQLVTCQNRFNVPNSMWLSPAFAGMIGFLLDDKRGGLVGMGSALAVLLLTSLASRHRINQVTEYRHNLQQFEKSLITLQSFLDKQCAIEQEIQLIDSKKTALKENNSFAMR